MFAEQLKLNYSHLTTKTKSSIVEIVKIHKN